MIQFKLTVAFNTEGPTTTISKKKNVKKRYACIVEMRYVFTEWELTSLIMLRFDWLSYALLIRFSAIL